MTIIIIIIVVVDVDDDDDNDELQPFTLRQRTTSSDVRTRGSVSVRTRSGYWNISYYFNYRKNKI